MNEKLGKGKQLGKPQALGNFIACSPLARMTVKMSADAQQ
jgi:hypothetical protein